MKTRAMELASSGLAVFPLHPRSKRPLTEHGFKDACIDPYKIDQWWNATPDANIGIATGSVSGGLVVVDVDVDFANGKDGMKSLKSWEAAHGSLPSTLSATTGRGGKHLYFRSSQHFGNTANQVQCIDVRGEGGYVVAPPSIHENGTEYAWNEPFDANRIAEADDNTLSFLGFIYGKESRGQSASNHGYTMPTTVEKGARNNELIRYLGSARQKGADDGTIVAFAASFNENRMAEPLGAQELSRTVESSLSFPQGPEFGTSENPLRRMEYLPRDDKTYSRVFGLWLSGRVCYVPEEKAYRIWDGVHWVKDTDSKRIHRLCKEFVDQLILYAQCDPSVSDSMRGELINFVNKYNRYNERKRLIEDTCCEVTVCALEFDAKDNLLNVRNGVIDLDTFEFVNEHDPGDCLSMVANVEFDPEATCEEWERFIRESLGDDEETIRYLQKVLGIALTTDTSQECMFLLLGKTRSGKSTTVETIQTMLNSGDDGYACACNPETFAVKRVADSSRPSSDVARLRGRRFVIAAEPSKNMLFNVAQLKQLTGRDTVTARFLNQNEIQFKPKFTLVMTANNGPKVNDATLFESDRIFVIPFNNHLEKAQRDTKLKDRLVKPKSLSGILNWCLEGLRMYREEGLEPSPAIEEATRQYAQDSDKIACFFEDCMIADESNSTGNHVFQAYKRWCAESGYSAEGKQVFFKELRSRNLLVESGTVNGSSRHNVVMGYKVAGEYIE